MESILKDNYKPTETLSMSDLLKADRDNQIQAQHLSKKCGKHLNECTYSKGYLSQPIFVCLTCTPNGDAGFCLGCSMNCHLDHNVIELWNKRHFRCDCGNSKFKSSKQNQCLLSCKKDDINDKNNYNHNFKGKYCYCNREYSVSQHTMHQCLNCQDWFHQTCIILNHLKFNPDLKEKYDQRSNHTNTDQKQDDNNHDEDSPFFKYFTKILIPQSPDQDNTFDSFICKDCAIKYDYFFVPYRWNSNLNTNTTSTTTTTMTTTTGRKRKFDENDDDNDLPKKRRKLNNNDIDKKIDCKRITLSDKDKNNVLSLIGGGLWFEDNEWINKLCECNNCKKDIYDKFGLNWLFENEIENEIEDINNVNNNNCNVSQQLTEEFSTDAMTVNTIQKLPRQQTLDNLNLMMKGTDFIKQKLFEYVRKSNKKIVNADDIHNIFQNLR